MSNQVQVKAHNYSESWLPLERECDDPYLNFERIRTIRASVKMICCHCREDRKTASKECSAIFHKVHHWMQVDAPRPKYWTVPKPVIEPFVMEGGL